MDAAELVAFGAANPQTAGPYPVDELVNWLRENGLARYDTNGAWEGLLVSIAQNGQTPIAFRNGLVDMLSHLRNPKSVQVDTHLDSYAPLLGALLASTGLSDEQIAEFYRRDGGRKYPEFADEAEATAAQAAAILRESQAIAREQITAAVSLADAARFAAEQAGSDGGACVAAWLAKANEVLA
jgi:anaerobic glycerol-3-phosphate dehydrogenase